MASPDTITTGGGRAIPDGPLAIGETVFVVPVPGDAIRTAIVTEVEKGGKVVVVQYCGVEKWKPAGWVFRTRKEADEQYWKRYAEVRRQAEEIVQVCAERDAMYGEVIARDSEIASLRERVAELEAGLRPFADASASLDMYSVWSRGGSVPLVSDYRRAAALLAKGTLAATGKGTTSIRPVFPIQPEDMP